MNLPPEEDTGSTEYKLHLVGLTDTQMQHRASQLQFRLEDGSICGQAVYFIGMTDDGFPIGITREEMTQSIDNLQKIVDKVKGATICSVEETTVTYHAQSEDDLVQTFILNPRYTTGKKERYRSNVVEKWNILRRNKENGFPAFTRYISEVIIRKSPGDYWEIKIAVAGNVDCGKSTLLGVLSSGSFDNGRGSARLNVLKHRHEAMTGRTSSIGQQIMGFDRFGNSVNASMAKLNHGIKHEWRDIVNDSQKIVTLFDLAGHIGYLSQTIRGLSGNQLDYAIVVVGANLSASIILNPEDKKQIPEWVSMTAEHLSIIVALGIQCIVVVTKIDSTPENVCADTIKRLNALLKSKFATYSVDDIGDVRSCIGLMDKGNIVPIVKVSNVTGEGHDILRKMLAMLPPKRIYINDSPPVMQIHEIYRKVAGVSIVIAGQLTRGILFEPDGKRQCRIKIGPLANGKFLETRVRSLECKRVSTPMVKAGRYVCIGLPKNDEINDQIRSGMFVIGSEMNPTSSWEFWLYVKLAKTNPTCMRAGYTPYCHIGHIRQSCKILAMLEWRNEWSDPEQFNPPSEDQRQYNHHTGLVTITHPDYKHIDYMGAGSHALILMRFCFKPELILDDTQQLIFRERAIKGLGTILRTTDTNYTPLKNPTAHKTRKNRLPRKIRKNLIKE